MSQSLLLVRKPTPTRGRCVMSALLGLAWGVPSLAMTSASTSALTGWHLQLREMNCTVERVCNRPTTNGNALTLFWSCAETERAHRPQQAHWQLFSNGSVISGHMTALDSHARRWQLDFELDGMLDRTKTAARLQLTMDGALISRTINPLEYGDC